MEMKNRKRSFPGGQHLALVHGDITGEDADAIVNAANERLLHGGGLAGIIARKGGPQVVEQSAQWVQEHGLVSHERPAYTSGGRLGFRYVIHAVGPVWGSGDEDRKLAAAVKGSLARAEQLGVRSLAMPAISTGIFGFPKERAAGVMLEALEDYYRENEGSQVEQVKLVLYVEGAIMAFEKAWEARWPG